MYSQAELVLRPEEAETGPVALEEDWPLTEAEGVEPLGRRTKVSKGIETLGENREGYSWTTKS